ncbi:MAG: hypothetical protein ACI4IK_01425 [Eubacterium sp.]
MNEHEKQIKNLMNANGIYGEVTVSGTGLVEILIEWGDWKHEHLALNCLINENFNVVVSMEKTTEEDGSDCYSAIHLYLIDFGGEE